VTHPSETNRVAILIARVMDGDQVWAWDRKQSVISWLTDLDTLPADPIDWPCPGCPAKPGEACRDIPLHSTRSWGLYALRPAPKPERLEQIKPKKPRKRPEGQNALF
jgi:hypothetical protein